MSQKIAIIELYQHDEVLDNFLYHLNDSIYLIEVYCSYSVFQSLNTIYLKNEIKWIPMKEKDTIPKFLALNKNNIQQNSLVILTTVFSHFKEFRLSIDQQKTLLILHNIHWQLAPKKHYTITSTSFIKDILRIVKVWILNTEHHRKQLVDRVDALGVGSKEILEYIHSCNNFSFKKKIFCVPFACHKRKKTLTSNEVIKIIVPGIVSNENRNYHEVLGALKQIKTKLRKKVQLILLGYPKNIIGKKIQERFSTFVHPQISVKYFTEPVSLTTYNTILLDADFLIIPARKKTIFHTCIELNGHSKLMGTLNDTIKFGKPTLLPSFYPISSSLTELIETYDSSKNLSEKIIAWVNNDLYISRASKTTILEKEYNCKTLKSHLIKTMNQVLT